MEEILSKVKENIYLQESDTLIKIGLLYEEQDDFVQAIREYEAAIIGDKKRTTKKSTNILLGALSARRRSPRHWTTSRTSKSSTLDNLIHSISKAGA